MENHGAGNAVRNFVVSIMTLLLEKNWCLLKNNMIRTVVGLLLALNKRITVAEDTIATVIKDGDYLGGWLLNQ